MHIAILGATSQIARDTILNLIDKGQHELTLYARRPEAVVQWLRQDRPSCVQNVFAFDRFAECLAQTARETG